MNASGNSSDNGSGGWGSRRRSFGSAEMPTVSRGWAIFGIVVFAVIVLLIAVYIVVSIWTDAIWFQSVGYFERLLDSLRLADPLLRRGRSAGPGCHRP